MILKTISTASLESKYKYPTISFHSYSVTTKVDFCPLAGAKPLAYQNSKPLAGGKPLVSRPNLWLAGRTFGWPAGPLVGNQMS